MGILDALLVIHVVLEHHLPFRGLVSDQIGESIKDVGFRHYMIAWLPTWWFVLACSMLSAGVGIGCSIWAAVGEVAGQPVGLPVLIGAASLVSAFAGLVVPISLAWFKDRSELRHLEEMKKRIHELELQVEINREGHERNATNIHKVTMATQTIADAAEKILESKKQLGQVTGQNTEMKEDRPSQDT